MYAWFVCSCSGAEDAGEGDDGAGEGDAGADAIAGAGWAVSPGFARWLAGSPGESDEQAGHFEMDLFVAAGRSLRGPIFGWADASTSSRRGADGLITGYEPVVAGKRLPLRGPILGWIDASESGHGAGGLIVG